jgi:hypothetical protein
VDGGKLERQQQVKEKQGKQNAARFEESPQASNLVA